MKRIKPAYLLFLAIPLLYYFLRDNNNNAASSVNKQDYLYFSVRTTTPAVISLYAAGDSLISWQVNSAGYKYLDYVGKIKDCDGIVLKVRNLTPNDTVFFSSFNLYRDNKIFSLYTLSEPDCILKNAHLFETGKSLAVIVQNRRSNVDVCLPATSSWKQQDNEQWIRTLIKISFLVIFIIIILLSPPVRYFMFSCALTLLLMILFFLVERDFQCQVALITKSQVKSFQTFYNNTPCFVAGKVSNSRNAGNSFNSTIDLNTDNCIRCDADGSAELADVHYKINAGMFSYDWDLATIEHSGMMMNDLLLRNNKFYVTGDDPHFVFTSNYFIGHVRWLLMMRKNLFLFISLLIFIILTAIHRWVAGISFNRLHPAYLFFILIPVIYYALVPIRGSAKPKSQKEHLYFSVRTSNPSIIELKDAGNTIDSWEVISPGYKYLQYSGDCIEDAAAYTILVKSSAPDDTISILSVNIFKNDQVISLDKDKGSLCRITDASIINRDGLIDAVVKTPAKPVDIALPLLNSWKRSTPERDIQIYVALLFIVLFLLIQVLNPLIKYLMSICAMASIVMIILFLINRHFNSHVAIQTGCPVKSVNFFYNDNPCFVENKKFSIYDWACFFKTNIPFSENNYLRCDINKDTKELNSLQVTVKDGFLHHSMDLCDIPHDKMLFNDIRYHNNSFIITGDDPYFCLTSSYFIRQLQWLMILKNNLFLFISLFIFIIYLAMHKLARENYK
ncbi:MAG: hypothetical protein ABR968_12480 [Bacteroidales bacterium]